MTLIIYTIRTTLGSFQRLLCVGTNYRPVAGQRCNFFSCSIITFYWFTSGYTKEKHSFVRRVLNITLELFERPDKYKGFYQTSLDQRINYGFFAKLHKNIK